MPDWRGLQQRSKVSSRGRGAVAVSSGRAQAPPHQTSNTHALSGILGNLPCNFGLLTAMPYDLPVNAHTLGKPVRRVPGVMHLSMSRRQTVHPQPSMRRLELSLFSPCAFQPAPLAYMKERPSPSRRCHCVSDYCSLSRRKVNSFFGIVPHSNRARIAQESCAVLRGVVVFIFPYLGE